jgi:geranylgeranyl pyrophosphate synthase
LVAGVDGARRGEFIEFGRGLGLLFQVADDILDVTGTAASLGKSPGKDAATGKLTYPAVYGLDVARSRLAEFAAGLSRQAAALEGADGVLDGLVAYVARRDR